MSQHGCPERLSNRSKGFQEDGASQPTMEVLVETLTGTAFEMTVSPTDTIFAIKSKIWRVEGIPVSQQHLVYNLRELEDAMSLHSLGITDGARLRLVLGMRGGPISTRRLPPPEPWRDIERLLDTNRDEAEWSCEGGASSSGCRVTVVVFREGERVNMLRVRENPDGSYSPLDHNYASSLGAGGAGSAGGAGGAAGERGEAAGGAGALQQNAVTMGKMMDLRRRMETLSIRRHNTHDDRAEIQKTRSEETLSVSSLMSAGEFAAYPAYSAGEAAPAQARAACGASPPAARCARAPCDQLRVAREPDLALADSMCEHVPATSRRALSDALAGSILVAGRRDEDTAFLEECLDAADPCRLRHDSPPLADIPAAEYGRGGLVCGGVGWRARGFGSSSALAPRGPPGLAGALLSSSTSSLEALRQHRGQQLQRHTNTESLHLSEPGAGAGAGARAGAAGPRRVQHVSEMDPGRYGKPLPRRPQQRAQPHHVPPTTTYPKPPHYAPHYPPPQVPYYPQHVPYYPWHQPQPPQPYYAPHGQQRAPQPPAPEGASHPQQLPSNNNEEAHGSQQAQTPQSAGSVQVKKKVRVRCGLCRKKLSIATVHRCRCGAEFCAPHRYAEVHGCAYDYKAARLLPAHAPLQAPKLPKI